MTRACFVAINKWGGHRPCPYCRADGYARPPGKALHGVMRLVAGVLTLGRVTAYLYECFTCKHEAETPA